MSDKPEPLSAVLAEMRDERIVRLDGADTTRCLLLNLADRLDAAAKRERIERDKVSFRCGDCAKFGCDCDAGDVDGNEDCIACEKFVRRYAAPGNAAALREALQQCGRALEKAQCSSAFQAANTESSYIAAALSSAHAALTAPARNCDVGTAKEQAVRKEAYCLRCSPLPTDNCDDCPLRGYNRSSPERAVGYSCDLAWGQLPYTPAEGCDHA